MPWPTIDETPLPDGQPPSARPEEVIRTDIAIIGSGMGGGTMAYALKDSDAKVLIIERGHRLPAEPQNSDLDEVYIKGRYKNADTWYNGRNGVPFKPGVYYWVGGNTKVYGACLPRFRASDFEATQHQDGISPAWPFSYADLEPYYTRAERLYQVRGQIGEDPTEPLHSEAYPHPSLDHEPTIQRLADSLIRQGLHPFRMPNGLDADSSAKRALCATSDGAPNQAGLKSDAEKVAVNPALAAGVELMTGTKVVRLILGPDGRTVVAALAERDGRIIRVEADKFILAAGAVNSAALLLGSATPEYPRGLANSSGLVGRNYMVHNSTFFIGINPLKVNRTLWQKTLGLNDWYEAGPTNRYPLGNLQMLGKLRASMLKMARPWAPTRVLKAMSDRSVDIYLTTEDLPRRNNGISVVDGTIHVWWEPNNLAPHGELVRRISKAVRKAGYPIIFTERMGIETNSHQCGTAVAGHDPATSVLTPDCRTHDLDNLWVVDSSFFPSSAALNPALTIAANALRVADTIIGAGNASIQGSLGKD
ncbi:GMC family oxidoreductase [Pseudarthrobacter sp. NIBRBAC000502772]|uniref:GMC oxidoreductase n=1 Tax=Pseudarthrobacter sp. NIBRBAC000502772 TaxID=2590775 RepID=UPI001130C4AB|nr:GMC family oxidoreductase [Pseudarthrobacter sp. NIBRBAC000502772]QDG68453.1 GMC family oxidoreductase [Pseudarthrobacter sp. NIBRBAC000502772]